MEESLHLEAPGACKGGELREFERLVRVGFHGSDDGLPGRIRRAKQLAFYRAADGEIAAIAGLKAPSIRYREVVFERAQARLAKDVPAAPDNYALELGWVFVLPEHRRQRIGRRPCRLLLEPEPESGVFAVTRPDNVPMIRILEHLGFTRAGRPYPHLRRDEQLVLFLNPAR